MSPSAIFVKAESKEDNDSLLEEIVKVFSAASSMDALKIFYTAGDGIESSTETIKKLNLTQKRYYTNLKKLMDTGLVEKVDGKYTHTILGKTIYNLIESLKSVLNQKEKLDLIGKILKTKNLSVEETEEIMKALLKDVNLISGGQVTNILGTVRIIEKWEKVVKEIVGYINKAKKEILFACKCYDARIMEEAFLAAVQREVEVFYILDKESKSFHVAQMFLSFLFSNHDVANDVFKFLKSPFLHIRYVNLPYSFLIVDKEYSMIAISTPLSKNFSFAFLFQNKKLSEKLSESFKELWKRSSDINLLNHIEKYKADRSLQDSL